LDQKRKCTLAENVTLVSIYDFSSKYSFDYWGNSSRLILTPLTLQSINSMLFAFKNNFGASLIGPTGTGKTETVKECAWILGRPFFL
jgi:dynein heavy chain